MTDASTHTGFTTPEKFGVPHTWKRAFQSLLGPSLLFPLVLFGIGWLIVNGLILGSMAGMPASSARSNLAGVISGGVIGAMTLLWVCAQERQLRRSWVSASPDGLVMRDGATTRTLRWDQMVTVGRVVALRGIEFRQSGADSAAVGQMAGKAVNRTVQALSGTQGILGYGTLVADADNAIAQKIVAVNAGVWGYGSDGRPYVGIAPALLIEGWQDGRLGDWVRHYRPDLAEQLS